MGEEREINLRFVFYQTLKRWRSAVIIGIIIALLAGGYCLYNELNARKGDSYDVQLAQYNAELVEAQRARDEYEIIISNIKNRMEGLLKYNATSLLMRIDPENAFIGSLYINVNDNSNNPRVFAAYTDFFTGGGFYEYLEENANVQVDLKYFMELFSYQINQDASMITVTVKDTEEAACRRELDLVKAACNDLTKRLNASDEVHTCSISGEQYYNRVDTELETFQKDKRKYLSDLNADLETSKKEYDNYLAKAAATFDLSGQVNMRAVIKYILLGGAVGLVLTLMFHAVVSILTKRIQGASEIKANMNLTVLGETPSTSKKKAFSFIDRLFYGLGELSLHREDYEKACALIGSGINGMLEEENDKKIFLIGASISEQQAVELASRISNGQTRYSCTAAGNILSDAAASKKAQEADYIVIAEQQDKATYTMLYEEILRLKQWDKKLLGIIITEADCM